MHILLDPALLALILSDLDIVGANGDDGVIVGLGESRIHIGCSLCALCSTACSIGDALAMTNANTREADRVRTRAMRRVHSICTSVIA